jgi:hypothetical protein
MNKHMDKFQMELLWKGGILNPNKINKFKPEKTNLYSCTIKIYKKVLVDEFTETGYYKNDKLAREDLESKLRWKKNEKYPYMTNPSLQWTFDHSSV